MGLFSKRKREADGPPPGINELHGFEAPGEPAPYVDAAPNYASRIGYEMPRLRNQDALLVHYYRPDADEPPQRWYTGPGGREETDWARQQANEHVGQSAQGQPFSPERVGWTGNPNFTPPAPSRVMRAPSLYSFTRDMGGQAERHLTGYHASMASINKTYQPLGMTPAYRNRNTFRMDPPPRDAYIVDVPANQDVRVTDSVFTSPNPSGAPSGLNRSFRLT